MFDWVNYSAPCKACGFVLTRWQSKNGPCAFETLEPWEVEGFYDVCVCGEWNEYRVVLDGPIPTKPVVPYHVVPSDEEYRRLTE